MVSEGFVVAQSDNLPKIDAVMVAEFFQANPLFNSAETRGVKTQNAGRESYGDVAVGYVELKRVGKMCTVQAKICPEHKVRNKQYKVVLEVDERNSTIVSSSCEDCAASLGGCKHSVAFLMWAHRRSEEPAPTETMCYWRKSKLAGIGTSLKYITLENFGKVQEVNISSSTKNQFLKDVLAIGKEKKISSQLIKYFAEQPVSLKLSMHHLMSAFVSQGAGTALEFLDFIKEQILEDDCWEACKSTVCQSDSKLWHELRYGRVTASRIYEAARCKVAGSLVNNLLGTAKVPVTEAMQRGKVLEKKVIRVLAEETEIETQSVGLLVSREYPWLGASPDAICDEYVVEVKCPSKLKTVENYVKFGEISNKCKAQIHLQMRLFNKQKGILCVADPNFELNNKISVYYIDFDEEFLESIMGASKEFWIEKIYPVLLRTFN